MGPALNKIGNRKIYQNYYFRPHFHFHFLICLVFPGIPLVKYLKNIWIFQISIFTMNCSTDKKFVFWLFLGEGFTYRWEKFQLCQSSNSCFLQKYPIFFITNLKILFFWLNICSFTTVQTKKIIVGWEMSKIQPFTFANFSLLNFNG